MSNKIWFIGTGKFAALCFEGLMKRGVNIDYVVTTNTPRARSSTDIILGPPSPVEKATIPFDTGIYCLLDTISKDKYIGNILKEDDPAIIFVVDFGQIIREPFLSRMCLNIHPSLLPEYRGAAPIQRALLDGRAFTGVSVFRLAEAMDAGDIFGQERTEILPNENASDLYKRLSRIGCDIAAEAVEIVADSGWNPDALDFIKQNAYLASYAPKIDKSEFALTFNMPAKKFTNTVRALDMSGGAYAVIRGKRVKVWRAVLREDIKATTPGQVLECSENPVVACADFCVELAEVQSAGKKILTGAEWMRGLRLQYGNIL